MVSRYGEQARPRANAPPPASILDAVTLIIRLLCLAVRRVTGQRTAVAGTARAFGPSERAGESQRFESQAPGLDELSREAVVQRLWCEAGQHDWSRVAVPGRKPSACPDHRISLAR